MSPASHDLDPGTLDRIREAARILALRALGDPAAAEEAAQETVVRLLEAVRAGRWRPETTLGTFGRGIARHVIADVLRRQQRVLPFPRGEADAAGTIADPLDGLVAEEQVERVHAALAVLNREDRELLRLCFQEGLTPGEIAARLDEPSERVRKRKSRALQRLRAAFFGQSGHESATAANDSAHRQAAAEPRRRG